MTLARFLIVGAGQSGLQLGLGLLDDGHDVTVVSNRTPEDLRNGRLTSGQCMFGAALATERALGIDLWEHECPHVDIVISRSTMACSVMLRSK